MGNSTTVPAVPRSSSSRKRSLGVYSRALWHGGMTLLVILVMVVVTAITVLEQGEALSDLHAVRAEQARLLVEQQIADIQTALALAAAPDGTITADGVARVVAAYPAINAVDAVDAAGPAEVTLHVPEAAPVREWGGTIAFVVVAGGERYAGLSEATPDEWIAAVPLTGSDRVLIAQLDAAQLFAPAVNAPAGDDGYLYLVAGTGDVVASAADVARDAAINPAEFAVFDETRAGGAAMKVYRGIEGDLVVGRAVAWPDLGLTALVETPLRALTPVAVRLVSLWVLALLLGVAIGEVVVRVLLHAVTQPLAVLRGAAQAASSKDYRYRVRMGPRTVREFAAFEQVFNAMLTMLSNNQRELDAYANEMSEIVDQRARQLTRALVQLEHALDLVRAVATIRDPQALIARVTDELQDRFDIYHADIWLVDDARSNLVLSGARDAGEARSLYDTGSLLIGVVTSGEPLYVPDVTGEARYHHHPARTATRSALLLPLVAEQVIGVLTLESDHRDAFPRDTFEVLERLAGEIAVALVNAQAFEALEHSNRDLAQATLQANQSNTLKSRFLYNVSQKLHVPLNTVVSSTETLFSGVDPNVAVPQIVRDRQRTIIGNGRVMQALVADMLDLSAIEAGHMLLNLMWVPLPPLLEEITNAARALHMTAYASHKLDIRLDLMHLTEPLPPVWADADRLRYILINLMSNAVKFTDSGDVVLSADTDGEDVWITVRDTGPGISDNEMRYLFEPFTQQKAPVIDHARGTGLGLAVSRLLAMRHGGDLTVETCHDEGTTFTLRLPCEPGGAPPRP